MRGGQRCREMLFEHLNVFRMMDENPAEQPDLRRVEGETFRHRGGVFGKAAGATINDRADLVFAFTSCLENNRRKFCHGKLIRVLHPSDEVVEAIQSEVA